jgi:L-rhamnonate dehydratase
MLREIIRNPVRLDKEGYIPVPQGPGLGIDVDEVAVRRFRVNGK